MAETGPSINPIEQFELSPVVRIIVGHANVSFTNSAIFMAIAAGLTVYLMAQTAKGTVGAPGRLQSLGEMAYEFVAGMVKSSGGEDAMRFFPLVFSIFMFILFCNLVGVVPYTFTPTSHIVITAALALLVFFTVVIVGLKEHGAHFFKLFVPDGVQWFLMPIVIPIEVISFFSRPLSHSIRLFANMLAGHIILNVFGGFVAMLLGAAAALKILALLPFAMTIGLEALELLVAFLQAYVFAMLTCMYLNDALHPGH